MESGLGTCWRIPDGQRLAFEEFDDGVMVFDALIGSTHLFNVTAVEALAIVQRSPGVSSADVHGRLLAELGVDDATLPFGAVEELLWRLEDLSLIAAASR